MKKIIAIVLMLVLVTAMFCGCQNSGKLYIPVMAKGFQHQFWQAVAAGSQAAADELGVEIYFDGPASETEIAAQVNMIEQEMAKNPKALALAALFYAAVYSTITPGTGAGQEMHGITGVIVGGTSMAGGSGTMVGTLIGVFIMSVLKNGLPACGLQAPWQNFFTGIVVIGAVLLDIQRTKAAAKVKKS